MRRTNGILEVNPTVDQDISRRVRDLRKRRGIFRSDAQASRELRRVASLLAAGSLEREIFERAEVGGTPYKAIAVSLNVSERHVYRIRRRMLEMIEAGERDPAARVPSGGSSGLDIAYTLLRYGHTQRALAAIRRLGNGPLAARERLDALALQAMAACDAGDSSTSRATIERLVGAARGVDAGDAPYAARRALMTRAYASYCRGLYEETIASCESALVPLFARPSDAVDSRDARAAARDATFLGIVHQEGGSPQRSVEVLTFAERLAARNPGVVPLGELAVTYLHRAFALAALPDTLEEARRDASRAVALADRHALPFERVWARLASAVLYEFEGNPAAALADAQQALDLGGAVLSGDPLARTHFIASRVEVFAHQTGATLDHIAEVLPLIPPDSLLATIAELVQARVYSARRDDRATFASASRAIAQFEQLHTTTHYLGAAYLRRAVAGERLGRDVRADSEAAVSLLSRGGWIPDQRQALSLCARVTANPRLRRVARELASART
jgi:tetratricopeptide (TPR) repeat protein